MGCASSRDQVYQIKQPQFSNRDINETRCDLDMAQHHLPPQACGYEFGINVQNPDPYSSPNKQKARQLAELQKLNHFMEIYKQMQASYQASRIDEAYTIQQQLKILYNDINFSIVPELESDKREQMFALAQQIEQRYLQLKKFQKQLLEGQWKQSYKEGDLDVRYNRDKKVCEVRVESEVDVCLQLMIATFGSFARYHQFMKFALSSKQIKKINTFQRLGEIVYDIPFCYQNTAYFEEIVIDRLAHDNSVVIGFSSLYKNSDLHERLQFYPVFESQPKLDFKIIVCKLEPLEIGRTKATLIYHFEGECEHIVDWVVDKLFKNIGIGSMTKLIEKARAFGEETDTEIFEGDDELYHHFHDLMKINQKKVMD